MTTLTIKGKAINPPSGMAFLDAGFRPFFLGAAVCAVATIAVWTAIYALGFRVDLRAVSLFQWHAHEMIYGYALAVVAGFMLTAIEKWTKRPRTKGIILLGLLGLWAIPRVLLLGGTRFIVAAGIFDLLFIALLTILIAQPIVLSRQWKQIGVLSKLIVIALGQTCFYAGAMGFWADGARIGIYGGLYILIGLILTIARRVVPQFIQRGVDPPVQLFNSRLIDLASLGLFVLFFIADLMRLDPRIAGGLAAALFGVHTLRLAGWYAHGIWKKPLLWSLYLSIVWIDIGFLLYALSAWGYVSSFLAIHAFSYGGIGLVTLSMMARVALGHTGRSVHHPPATATLALLILAVGTVVRVLLPWGMPEQYLTWIVASQCLWMLAFLLFVLAYFFILVKPDASPQA